MSAPLDGVIVLAVEQAIAAPFCTRQLVDLGARVLKIERPGTGDFRLYWRNEAGPVPELVRGGALLDRLAGHAVVRWRSRPDHELVFWPTGASEPQVLLRGVGSALVVVELPVDEQGGRVIDRAASGSSELLVEL